MGHEAAVGVYVLVHSPKLLAACVYGEAADRPEHFAQEVRHRAEVVEANLGALGAQVDDLEANSFGLGLRLFGAAPVRNGLGAIMKSVSSR